MMGPMVGVCFCNGCGNRPGPWHERDCAGYRPTDDLTVPVPWRIRNRQKYNDYMRKYMREYRKRRADEKT